MSTTPDPTPFDETPVDTGPLDTPPLDTPPLDTTPLDTTPVEEYIPVEPTLAGPEAEPLLTDVPPVDAVSGSEPRPTLSETAAAMRESDLKAFYAFAGFTELAVGAVRSTVTDTQRWANARLAELRFRRQELAKQTEQVRKIAEGRVPEDIKAVPEVARGRVTELQEQATSTYSDLATRGQRVLNGVRSDVTGRIDPAFDKIQERIDAARALIKSRAAATPAATTPAPEAAAPTVPDGIVPETLVADGVLIDDGASEPLEPLDEVISPAGHGDEVPPVFDAPTTDRQI